MIGIGVIGGTVAAISWIYFFPVKRLGGLRVPKSIEVLGRDTIINANSKGLDLN
jgi:ammonia channel protein AmtB